MEWLTYLSKVSACTALFYAFYYFFLQRLTFFSVNRIYLLSTLVLSFMIPALQIEVQEPAIQHNLSGEATTVYTSNFAEVQSPRPIPSGLTPGAPEAGISIDWQEVIFRAYWLFAGIIMVLSAIQVLQLLKHARHISHKVGRLKVVYKTGGFTNCSFLNYVFIDNRELSAEEMAIILQHEQAHVGRFHSVDKLLMSAFKAILWFNPLIYLYDKALEQVHEYEADKGASILMGDRPYANLLLALAVRKNNPALVHSFVRNPLKGRIKMLFSKPSKNSKKLMYLAALPLGLVLIWIFALQVVYASQTPQMAKKTSKEPVFAAQTPLKQRKFSVREIRKLHAPTVPSDTLWMVDGILPGKYKEVIIDGQPYDIDILTRISPRCIRTTRRGQDKIELTTLHNRIEYATKIDRENVLVRRKALASGKIYVRYRQIGEDGSRYDWINIKVPGGAGGGVGLDRGKQLLLLYEGKKYTERQFMALTADQLKNRSISFRSGLTEEITTKYGRAYGSMIEVSKEPIATDTTAFMRPTDSKKIFRRPMSLKVEDAYGNLTYSAQDSTVYIRGLGDALLYGSVKLKNSFFDIDAEKARFNGTDHTLLAKNVSFKVKDKEQVLKAAYVRFDLHNGRYELLNEIKGL